MEDAIKKQIAATFAANAEVEKLIVTKDGSCFTPDNEGEAFEWAKRVGGDVTTVDKKTFKKEIDAIAIAEAEAKAKLDAETTK